MSEHEFMKRVKDIAFEKKCTMSAAIIECRKLHPELHKNFIISVNPHLRETQEERS